MQNVQGVNVLNGYHQLGKELQDMLRGEEREGEGRGGRGEGKMEEEEK